MYLSCDTRNTFFKRAVREAIDEFRPSMPAGTSLDLVYPPDHLGVSTGTVLGNVLELRNADVVIFDVTPTVEGQTVSYNTGVMIEYGMVVALENPPTSWLMPWGRTPRPVHQVFCDSVFPRRNLTPIINADVTTYPQTDEGMRALKSDIRSVLERRIAERVEYSYAPGSTSGISSSY